MYWTIMGSDSCGGRTVRRDGEQLLGRELGPCKQIVASYCERGVPHALFLPLFLGSARGRGDDEVHVPRKRCWRGGHDPELASSRAL